MDRSKYVTRWSRLKDDRSSYFEHAREISKYLAPRKGRFFLSDPNRGDKKHGAIIDNAGSRALKIMSAGLMSNMTSPARPWFRVSTANPELDESHAVKTWLADVTRLLQMLFHRSNVYRALHMMYNEVGAFGTCASVVLPDDKHGLWFYPLSFGEYAIATDHLGRVDTLYREFQLTADQMVRHWGESNVSSAVRAAASNNNLDSKYNILHVIEPRASRDHKMADSVNMPWKSCYMESSGTAEHKYLSESGFQNFGALCGRWEVEASEIYGSSPGMEALGDIKQLQQEQVRKGQAIDYQTKPPVQAPASMQGGGINLLPGGENFYSGAPGTNPIRSIFESNLNLQHLREDIMDVRQRINATFYADLFLMLAQDTRSGTTAFEIAQRQEEKMLMLGPVVERMHNEMLEPLIDMAFQRLLQMGAVPPLPPELDNQPLNVEFVSVLAQAQRAIATGSVDRYVANLGAIAQYKPDVLDKFDSDQWADIYGDMLGVDPSLIVPSDRVALIRNDRAKAQAQAAQTEQAVAQSQAAKNLSQAQTSGGSNLLENVMSGTTGYTM